MKWYTTCIYVDTLTGETLTKEQIRKEFIISNKKTSKNYEHKYISGKRETIGYITHIYECTRRGKQLTIWQDC